MGDAEPDSRVTEQDHKLRKLIRAHIQRVSTRDNLLTIPFGRDLSLEQAEEMFKYIAKELPANFDYGINLSKTIHDYNGFEKETNGLKVSGKIVQKTKPFAFDMFSLKRSEDLTHFYALKFSRIPGYDEVSEYDSRVVDLWKNVRTLINQYLQNLQE